MASACCFPFPARWLRADTTSVVDLWIWAVLALGIVGPFLARLVGSEISSGSAKERHHGRGFAWFALLLVLLYDGGRGVLHARAVGSLASRMYDGTVPLRVAAMPDMVNPLKWRGIVETPGAYVIQDLNLAANPGIGRGTIFHKPDPEPAIDAARRTATFQGFLRFSQYPLWRVTPYAGSGRRQTGGGLRLAFRHTAGAGIRGARGGGFADAGGGILLPVRADAAQVGQKEPPI